MSHPNPILFQELAINLIVTLGTLNLLHGIPIWLVIAAEFTIRSRAAAIGIKAAVASFCLALYVYVYLHPIYPYFREQHSTPTPGSLYVILFITSIEITVLSLSSRFLFWKSVLKYAFAVNMLRFIFIWSASLVLALFTL